MDKLREKLEQCSKMASKILDFETSQKEHNTFKDNIYTLTESILNLENHDTLVDTTTKEEVFNIGKVKLLHYKPTIPDDKLNKTPLLIVYALFNKKSLVDINPNASAIKKFLDAGQDVYVIDWGDPKKDDMYVTLSDYINYYIDECVDFIRNTHKIDKITLFGVCQGGLFSVIYTAFHSHKIKNLITTVVPIGFDEDGILMCKWGSRFDYDKMADAWGIAQGYLINFLFLLLKPFEVNVSKYVNLVKKVKDLEFVKFFMRMEKWVFDCPDIAGETYREYIRDFYRYNKLVKGEFELDGEKINLKKITCPFLCACAEYDHIVPIKTSTPIMELIGSKDKKFLSFKTGHVGMFVSGTSAKSVMPEIINWLNERK